MSHIIAQKPDQWHLKANNGPVNISDVCISDGGLLLCNQNTSPDQIVTLKNVYNLKGSNHGGVYFVMLWPPGDQHTQQAIPKLIWDNTDCPHPIVQGSAECAFRAKCDDATVKNVIFKGFLQSNGQPYKQVIEIRHGKKWLFDGCTFQDSWPDLGQQKVAGQGYVTSQQIDTVAFKRCRFTRWAGKNTLIHRCPGVKTIIYSDCIDPDGKRFSKVI